MPLAPWVEEPMDTEDTVNLLSDEEEQNSYTQVIHMSPQGVCLFPFLNFISLVSEEKLI